MCQSDSARAQSSVDCFSVICLCAEWCGTCREYRDGFEALADQFGRVRFLWLDIEEHAEALGDLDIENFPTILIRRGDCVLFFGTLPPQISHLRRLIQTFVEQTPEESRGYAFSNPERSGWQKDADLARVGLG